MTRAALTHVGPYEIVRSIGRGGMAEVFLGRLRGADGFQRDVAVKRVLPGYAQEQGFLDLFRREAEITAELRHGNIVQVLEFRQDDGDYYLVLEYVDGMSLAALLDHLFGAGATPAPSVVAFILSEVARALDYAHRKQGADGSRSGVIHRDVSPSNVLVSREGAVKLADFGIAAAASRATVSSLQGLKGKISYMAPERLDDGVVDGRSDIYSLGVLGWEMVVGDLPHAGASIEAKVHNILSSAAPRVATRVPEVPRALGDIIDRMLERVPTRRPARGLEVADVLAALTAGGKRRPEEELGDLVARASSPAPSMAATIVQVKKPVMDIAAAAGGAAAAAGAARRVLVLESSKTVRALVRAAVGSEMEVIEVEEGRTAIDLVAKGGIALVVSQQVLAGAMAGAELCEALRQRGSDVPFVLMLSEVTPEDEERARAAGVSAVVAKADPQRVMGVIREHSAVRSRVGTP